MKYIVDMSCGHKGEVNLIGKNEEREKKIRYYKQYGLCKNCYAEKINQDNSNGCNEIKMPYADYKNLCPEYKTKRNSYCTDDKTVVVYVPVGDRSMNIDIDAYDDVIDMLYKIGTTPVEEVNWTLEEYKNLYTRMTNKYGKRTVDTDIEAKGE